jgi:prolipoprotein diacylglyceryltransferase
MLVRYGHWYGFMYMVGIQIFVLVSFDLSSIKLMSFSQKKKNYIIKIRDNYLKVYRHEFRL